MAAPTSPGTSDDSLTLEREKPSSMKAEGAKKNSAFEIWLVWSDQRITVAEDETALDALLDAGVDIEPGCQVGGCGECMTQFVEGDVIHKDSCLSLFERKHHFCPCVSRATGVLALPF